MAARYLAVSSAVHDEAPLAVARPDATGEELKECAERILWLARDSSEASRPRYAGQRVLVEETACRPPSSWRGPG